MGRQHLIIYFRKVQRYNIISKYNVYHYNNLRLLNRYTSIHPCTFLERNLDILDFWIHSKAKCISHILMVLLDSGCYTMWNNPGKIL